VKARVVLEGVSVRENGTKTRVAQKYSPSCSITKFWNKCLWIEESCWRRGIDLELVVKIWACKKNSSYMFSWLSIRKHLKSNPHLSMPCFLCHKSTKQNTIGVVKGANAKLPHCTCIMLTYLMENKMPLVHHTVEWQKCSCTIEDDKSLNERTQGHLMMKPMCIYGGEVVAKEGIESRWSQGFGLHELVIWQECWWWVNPQMENWHPKVGHKILGGSWECVEEMGVGWGYHHDQL
jgi:hypothetical protein